MPTYEYVCTDCDHHWEEVQKISEPALEVCPQCAKSTAKRQISAGNFILKGGGWYADLYSSSPKKKEGKAEGAGTAAGSGNSSTGGSASSSPATPSSSSSTPSTPSSTSPSAPSKSPGSGSSSSGSSGSSGSGSGSKSK